MTAQEAYILAKAYTKKSIEGAGSLKGAACKIKSIEAITGGHRITFEWEDNDGEVSTDTMDVMDGADGFDGVGISSITYKETDAHGNYVYTVTLTDTNTYDIICPKGAQGETGATGATGNGISSIVKTSTAGLVDTYTITYTNGQTTTFTVTNGESITVDSAMSGSSTNPVQNKVITEALADKQDAEDNNLTTEAKTIVGAINEHEGDIGSLKSGLTTLDDEVNGDATTYDFADVITIEDAVPANLADCSVKIEPVQDLHGYDHPWVGGAGKNKLPLTTAKLKADNVNGTWNGNVYSYRGIDFTITEDNGGNVIEIDVNGTSNTDFAGFNLNASITQGSYKLNGISDGSQIGLRFDLSGIGDYKTLSNGELSVDAATDAEYTFMVMVRTSGTTVNHQKVYPMIRLATETDATFAPYTNICPISGHTETSVQRDGRNLFNINDSYINRQGAGGTYNISGNSITVTSSTQTSAFAGFIKPLEVGETYTISYTSTSKIRILQIDEPITVITQGYYGSDTDSGTSFVANKPYILINCVGDTSGVTYSNIQLEKGSSATDYEPYQGKTYTIALGDTIYGAKVNPNTGAMTVTHQYVTKNTSTMNNLEQYPGWTGAGIKQIVGGGIDDIVSTCVNVSDVIRANTLNNNDILFFEKNDIGLTQTELIALAIDVEFVVELATPTTIQLTPQQIQLLKGTNTLTASTGDISVTVNGVSGAIGQVQEQVNELADKVTVAKELRYTGTGTTPNTIDFGNDTPKRILGIIPDPDEEFVLSNYEAVGEITWGMLLALSYWSTQSGGVPTTNNGGTNMVRMSFSGNTVTLSAGNAAQIANYSGQKYLLKYEV